jgi:hypothetical protein
MTAAAPVLDDFALLAATTDADGYDVHSLRAGWVGQVAYLGGGYWRAYDEALRPIPGVFADARAAGAAVVAAGGPS